MNSRAKSTLERDVVATRTHALRIKRKELAIGEKLNEIDRQIEELRQKRRRVEDNQKEIRVGPLESAFLLYSQAFLMALTTRMRDRLPRELRDIVYGYLLFNNPDLSTHLAMQNIGRMNCDAEPCPGTPCRCLQDLKVLHFINPFYVCEEIALEIITAYYNSAHIHNDPPLAAANLGDIERLICNDIFHFGFDPGTMLRHLIVRLKVEDLVMGGQNKLKEVALVEGLAPLWKIVNKAGFKLDLILEQTYIKVDLLEEVINVAGPILRSLEKEGAKISIQFIYTENWKASWPLIEAYKDPESDWKRRMTDYLKSMRCPLFNDSRSYSHRIFHIFI